MAYDIYVNGELVDTEMSFTDAMMYIQEHNLWIAEEVEHINEIDPTIELYCVEA